MAGNSGEESGAGVLAETQQAAFGALRAGQSFAEAAEAAGVHRATVFRWMQRDPQFRAAYNAWKGELRASAQARLLKLADKAVDVIEQSLNKGNEKVAMKMLKQLAVMRRPSVGTTDPELLEVEMDVRDRSRRFQQVKLAAKTLLDKAGFSPADQRRYIRKYGYNGIAKQMAEIGRRKTQQAIEAIGPAPDALSSHTKALSAPAAPDATVLLSASQGKPLSHALAAPGPGLDATEDATASATGGTESHTSNDLDRSQESCWQQLA